jgi:hypothetical protein
MLLIISFAVLHLLAAVVRATANKSVSAPNVMRKSDALSSI